MRLDRSGVTRSVLIGRIWVYKIAKGRSSLIRGVIANRSEWHQRDRTDVARPAWTFLYLIQCYPKASYVPHWSQRGPWDNHPPRPSDDDDWSGWHGDEYKASSWGRFRDRWLLIDYDRGHQERDWLIGKLYYGNQERLGRKWAKLTNEAA